MLSTTHRRVASLAGRRAPCIARFQHNSSTSTDRSENAAPSHIPRSKPLTGSAKLLAEALEEEYVSTPTASPSRDHLIHNQGEIWTGEESTHDAVLRMIMDVKGKPLRESGGIKHNASDEKIKNIVKGLDLNPRLGNPIFATKNKYNAKDETVRQEGEEEEEINPHKTTIPPHLHRPWHSTYTGEMKLNNTVPQIKYGTFIKSRKDGDSLTNLLELQLPVGADGKTRSRIKEARKSSRTIRRLDNAREGALDYKLGLTSQDGKPLLVDLGEEDLDLEVDTETNENGEQVFKGNRQIKGSSVLGAQKGSASGMRAWGGLVEDRIQRAKEAGFFKVTNGKGKPIPRDPEASNPHLETGELLMNRIVKRQGALPPWIELQHSLDATLNAFRSTLLTTYTTHLVRNVISTNALSPLPPLHSIPSQDDAWEAREFKFHQENIKQINDLVRRMNAQAPSPARRHLYTLEGELSKIRGEMLKNHVWNEIKRRAEDAARIPANKSSTSGLPPFIFDNEGWNALKTATRRSFGTIAAPVSAVIGTGRVGGTVNSTRESFGSDGGSSGQASSGSSDTSDPKPLRLFVMAGVGIGAVVYFSRRPVQNDSEVEMNLPPVAEKQDTIPEESIVALSPAEPPLEHVGIIQLYIIEPLATLFRFFHLALLFGPVILTTPMLLVGKPESRRRRRSGKPLTEEEENWGAIWWYSFLVKQMERAGPSFIKLGQWAASRADLFPSDLCEKMSKLHSNGKPHSLKHTKKVMEKAFGLNFDDIFEEFGEEPIGCGAIAQVYKAKLKPSVFTGGAATTSKDQSHLDTTLNRSVAIKVLHPRARKTIRRDIAIMSVFANIFNAFPGMEWLSLPEEVEVFGEMMNSQLDLRVEASNLEKFEVNFQKRGRRVTFPSPIKLGKDDQGKERQETQDVLIEEFENALPLKWFLTNGGGDYDDKIAGIGLDAFLEMLLLDNWTHGDLHPGNIMVRFYKPTTTDYLGPLLNRFSHKPQTPPSNTPPSANVSNQELVDSLASIAHDHDKWHEKLEELYKEGYEPQLIFIDAGLVTSLDSTNRRNFLDLFQSVAEFDGYKAGKLMVERCKQPEHVLDEETFALKMQHIVLSVKSKTFSLAKIKISDILNDVLNAVRTHHVKLEGDFINTVLSILLLEGIGRQLDPDMDLFKSALPILRQLGRQMGTKEALNATPKGNLLAMIKLWVWVEARQVAGEASTMDNWIKYDRLFPAM